MHCSCTLKKVLPYAVQDELNDANKRKSSSTSQNYVINLSKISGIYHMPYTSLIKQDTPFVLWFILNPLAKGLHYTSPSPSNIWNIKAHNLKRN
jgi:hypothetical protein